MKYLIIFLLLNATIIIHELAHVIAIWKNRLEIEEIALGWPLIPLKLSIKLRNFRIFGFPNGNLRLSVYPLLIGAFVKPRDNNSLEALPPSRQMVIYWAGPFANLSIGLLLFLVYTFLLLRPYLSSILIFVLIESLVVFFFEILISLPYLVTKFKKRKMSFLAPAFTVIFLGLVVWGFVWGGGIAENLIGPVGIISSFSEMFSEFKWEYFLVFIVLMLSIGLFNALPIPPLDGGKIMTAFLREKGLSKAVAGIASVVGLGIIIGLFVFVTIKDIIFLFLK